MVLRDNTIDTGLPDGTGGGASVGHVRMKRPNPELGTAGGAKDDCVGASLTPWPGVPTEVDQIRRPMHA